MSSANRRSTYGFTVTELLVVIGIIALLVSLVLPMLAKGKETARGVNCLANLHEIFTGWMLGLEDNGWLIPYTENAFSSAPDWYDILDSVFPDVVNLAGTNDVSFNSCPTVQNTYDPMYSAARWGYAVNTAWNSSVHINNELQRWDNIRSPGNYPWFMDPEVYPFSNGFASAKIAPNTTNPKLKDWGVGAHHNQQQAANVVFADGAARSVLMEDIRQQAPDANNLRWFDNR